MISNNVQAQRPFSPLTMLTLVALVINTVAYASEFMWLGLDREISIIVGLLTVACLLVVTRWRWTPVIAVLLVGGILLGNPFLLRNLSLPMNSGFFLAALTQVVSGIVVVLAGIGTLLQNYRK
jgi:type IV secretory pathway TrbD component